MVRISAPCKCTKTTTISSKALPAGSRIAGQVSLAFVIDTTGSMDVDISNVMRGASEFLRQNKKFKVFDEYLLTTFADPGIVS